jgi:HAD superfamily hydrolase (TIGR01509 family)
MSIDAIIFDLGGTLIEYAGPYQSWPDLETPGFQAAYTYLEEAGADLPPFEQFRDAGFEILPGQWQRAVAGEANLQLATLLDEVVRACNGQNGVKPEQIATAAARYEAAICRQAKPLPGAAEALTYVKERGYRMGLLSNTMFRGEAHRRDLERFGLGGYFDAMLFSGDAAKWKPNPAPFLHLLDELEAEAETAVFIGDSPAHDIVGAQQAGMQAILIRSSQRFPLPDTIRPDAAIQALAELPAALTTLAKAK